MRAESKPLEDINYPPFIVGGTYNTDGLDLGYITDINLSLTLNGQTYYNVAETNHTTTNHTTDSTSSYYYNDWFYINDSVGIVKMRLHHVFDSVNLVWELQRYNIVK